MFGSERDKETKIKKQWANKEVPKTNTITLTSTKLEKIIQRIW